MCFSTPGPEVLQLLFIFCDTHMPGLTGLEFLQLLRESPFRDVPVVMHSRSDTNDDLAMAHELGAMAYNLKGMCLESRQRQLEAICRFYMNPERKIVTLY